VVGAWGAYGKCSRSCGTGSRSRARDVKVNATFGGAACPKLSQLQVCGTADCPPKSCHVSPWSPWYGCSASCGGGIQQRTRLVVHAAKRGGLVCPSLSTTRQCSLQPCPVDCKVKPEAEWGACSSDWAAPDGRCAADGAQQKTHRVLSPAAHGGRSCESLQGAARTRKCARAVCVGAASRPRADLCGRLSQIPSGGWGQVGKHGLEVTVSTAACKFAVTPQYVFSITGTPADATFGLLTPATVITQAGVDSFTVRAWYPFLRGPALFKKAADYAWQVGTRFPFFFASPPPPPPPSSSIIIIVLE
jgi:hypothetical protein